MGEAVNTSGNSGNMMQRKILSNIQDGVMYIGFNGIVNYVNDSALNILGIPEEDLIGKSFAANFFDNPENDDFAQAVLDSVYDRAEPHDAIVTYTAGDRKYTLRMLTSFFTDGDKRTGIIVLFSDLSELMELRDAVQSMQKIKMLNDRLELRNKLLSETFGRFLSDDIVKQLLDTPKGLELGGTKRTLTIMMSDLRGFTALSERMDAGDLISLLNHYLEAMTDAIQGNGGTIIEFIGDGILAIFGAPAYYENHAERAVAAALSMESAMERVNEWNKEHGYETLEMGIGLHTGEVIVGNIGSEKRTKYGVAGSAVNLCGRIESYTVGGQILISPDTRAAVGCELEVAKELTVYPKGSSKEIVLSLVTGIGAPYDIHVKMGGTKPVELKSPIPVCFHKLDGKHRLEGSMYGGLKAVANDVAVLETSTKLNIMDNIEIEAGGDLYCKVMDEEDGGYLLQYTAVPAGYDKWIKSYL